jgi:error-prone DNA polymerase
LTRRSTGEPDPAGPHLLVLARGPEGYRRLSRQLAAAHLAGGEGEAALRFRCAAGAAGGHWHILTGCRKGHVRLRWPPAGWTAVAALAGLVDRFGAGRSALS